ncbi:MAG: hypothetical protein ACI8ZH_000549 [Flavobacteriales bacterium]|jgi:hypothetical protein
MKVKEIFKVVFSIVIAVFILSISIGMNISKMKCDEDGALYLGSEVPSCSMQNEVVCETEQAKVVCCILEIQKSCCPEKNDNSCASETQNFHFDFETLLTPIEIDFSITNILLATFSPYDTKACFIKVNNYFSGIPPPKLNKPILSQIQSFLL